MKIFPGKCNQETVDLDPLEDPEELKLVHDLLDEFKQKTGSQIAEQLLEEWPQCAQDFVKV